MSNTLVRMKHEASATGYSYSLFLSAGAVESKLGLIPEGTQGICYQAETRNAEDGMVRIYRERVLFESTDGVSLGEWTASYAPPVRPNIVNRGPEMKNMTLEGTLEHVLFNELIAALCYHSMQYQ